MILLPIADRELRQAARRLRTYSDRTVAALIGAGIGIGIILIRYHAGSSATVMGRDLFTALSVLMFGVCLLAGPLLTADCVSRERREETLGLLFLTDLHGYDVALGKLLAASLPIFYCLIATFPVLAWSFFLGGVSGDEFARSLYVLINTLFVSLAMGLFVSTLSRDGRKAMVATVLFLAAISVGLPGLAQSLIDLKIHSGLADFAALGSPAYAFSLILEDRYALAMDSFIASCWVMHGLGWLLVVLTSLLLPRVCHEASGETVRFWSRIVPRGGIAQRKASQRALLDVNPIGWLAGRVRAARVGLWITLIVVGLLMQVVLIKFIPGVSAGLTVLNVTFVLHALIKAGVAWEASRRFAEDRSAGSLELLLTTPLTERDIIHGWMVGLKKRFLIPVGGMLMVDLCLWFGGFLNDSWWDEEFGLAMGFLAGMVMFLLDAYAVAWLGFALGMTSPSSARAFGRTVCSVLLVPWIPMVGVMGVAGVLNPAGGIFQGSFLVGAFWVAVGLMVDVTYCAWAMSRLQNDFREFAARQPTPRASLAVWLRTGRERLAQLGAVTNQNISNLRQLRVHLFFGFAIAEVVLMAVFAAGSFFESSYLPWLYVGAAAFIWLICGIQSLFVPDFHRSLFFATGGTWGFLICFALVASILQQRIAVNWIAMVCAMLFVPWLMAATIAPFRFLGAQWRKGAAT